MWTRAQRTILALTPKFASVLTFLGSSWIIVEVVTSKQKLSHPYHRLLLMMSVYDATEAIGNFMSTWPIPPHTVYNQVWAAGNQQACSTQGFVLMLAIAVPIYNAMLACYYMLVINHNFTDRTLRLYFEPCVHFVAFAWAFGTAITAAAMGLYNNSNLWCWIAPLPHDCLDSWRYGDQGNCVRGDNAWIYRWAFYFAPLWLCILIASKFTGIIVSVLITHIFSLNTPIAAAAICTLLVYKRVMALDKLTLRYRRPEGSITSGMSEPTASFTSRNPSSRSGDAAAQQVRNELDLAAEEKKDDEFLSGRPPTEITIGQHNSRWSPNTALRHWYARRAIYREDYRRTVEVKNQAIWYLSVFYLTHVWATTTRIIQQVRNGKTFFGVVLVHSIFDPLQGFSNFVVYQRPRYIKIRRAQPNIGVFGAIWRALRFSYLSPPPTAANPDQERPAGRQGMTATFPMPTIREDRQGCKVTSVEDSTKQESDHFSEVSA
jgi:hypothetical protein